MDRTQQLTIISSLLTYEEASGFLSIKVNTLYAMVAQKRIPHIRLGSRLVRFDRQALEEWVLAGAVQPGNASTGT